MSEEVPRTTKNQAFKRPSSDMKDQSSMEQKKRGKSPAPMPPLASNDAANKSPFIENDGSRGLDDDFENIVKTIRRLEGGGHVSEEFRLKFLTWYGLRSREHQRRVVRTFVKIMIDDPSSLAGQLVDTFSDIIFSSRP